MQKICKCILQRHRQLPIQAVVNPDSGVSRISAIQRGGCLRSGPIRKVGGAVHFRSDIRKVGGGGAVHFRSDIRKVGGGGGGQSTSGPIYEKWGGGGGKGQSTSGPIYEKWVQVRYTKSGGGAVHFRFDIRKVGGGGGGGGGNSLQVRYEKRRGADTFVWHKENTL